MLNNLITNYLIMSVSVFDFESVIVLNGFFLQLSVQNNTVIAVILSAAERKLKMSVWLL